MAKAPDPKRLNQTADDTITIGVAGVSYTMRLAEISAAVVRAIRAETGRSMTALLEEMANGQPDLDTIATVVWIARRQAGETVSLADVESAITYSSLQLDAAPAEQDPLSPEA